MADDAADAARRTPRTDDVPDTFRCHEPFHRDAEVRVSFTGRYYAGAFMGSHIVDADDHHRCTVPPDAVTPLPDGNVVERAARPLAVNALRRYEAEQGFADHLTVDDFMADAREDVRALAADSLLADPERGRPVVLLRAEDCACPVGGDCPHGPEPVDALDLAVWLHAESEHHRAWLLRAAELELASHTQAEDKLTAERDAILPRLAELAEQAGKARTAEWLRACASLPPSEWPPAPTYKGPMVPAAELEEARRERDTWESEYERVRDLKLTDLADALRERDVLSLMLRTMARKLVAYRKWALGDDVPAVHRIRRERDLALWLHAEAAWQRDQVDVQNGDLRGEIEEARVYAAQHHRQPDPAWTLRDLLVDFVEHLKAERDALQARLDEVKRSYDLKLQDFARETARVSAGLRACTVTPTNENVPKHIVGEALLGWIGAQEHIGAALQGDQPAPVSRDDEVLGVCRDAIERGWTVDQLATRIRAVYDPELAAELKRRARAAEAAGFDKPEAYRGEAAYWLEGDDEIVTPAEPAVTPPDLSGRIVDGGPVIPFADEEVDRG